MTTEAAERLRNWMLNGDGRLWVADLDAAIAAERRATVERIRAALLTQTGYEEGILAILDAEAAK